MPNEEKVTIAVTGSLLTYTRKCKECYQQFTASASEIRWLKEKGLAEFKRCPECRAARKRDHLASVLGMEQLDGTDKPSNSDKNDNPCFLGKK